MIAYRKVWKSFKRGLGGFYHHTLIMKDVEVWIYRLLSPEEISGRWPSEFWWELVTAQGVWWKVDND